MNMRAPQKSLLSSSITNTLVGTGAVATLMTAAATASAETTWEIAGYTKLKESD